MIKSCHNLSKGAGPEFLKWRKQAEHSILIQEYRQAQYYAGISNWNYTANPVFAKNIILSKPKYFQWATHVTNMYFNSWL